MSEWFTPLWHNWTNYTTRTERAVVYFLTALALAQWVVLAFGPQLSIFNSALSSSLNAWLFAAWFYHRGRANHMTHAANKWEKIKKAARAHDHVTIEEYPDGSSLIHHHTHPERNDQ
jgi:hypothetical protein